MLKFFFILICTGFFFCSFGQGNITLMNGSFEDNPRAGGAGFDVAINNWSDCSKKAFPNESPPDIHPDNYWQVTLSPADGNTYLGMVVRDNDSWESLSQRLSSPLQEGICYTFSIQLARSEKYMSGSKLLVSSKSLVNYNKPAILIIYGGDGFCSQDEILAESSIVENSDWETYTFEFKPKRNHRYITLEANYKTPVLIPYNGHILVDAASDIIRVACPGEDYVSEKSQKKKSSVFEEKVKKHGNSEKTSSSIRKKNEPVVSTSVSPPVEQTGEAKTHSHTPKLLTELNLETIKKGQTINIKDLYFDADTSSIHNSSYPVLEEVFHFLEHNIDIEVEIRGHTNGVRGITHAYCDKLSTDRARAIATFLISKGIAPERVLYKGYGKRKPIATNRTREGMNKNQRVEIKILDF